MAKQENESNGTRRYFNGNLKKLSIIVVIIVGLIAIGGATVSSVSTYTKLNVYTDLNSLKNDQQDLKIEKNETAINEIEINTELSSERYLDIKEDIKEMKTDFKNELREIKNLLNRQVND